MKNKKANFFDVIIVLVILCIICAVIFRSQVKEAIFKNDSVSLNVTVQINAIPNEAKQLLTEGVAFSAAGSGENFGKVVSASFSPVKENVIVGNEEVLASSSYFSSAVIVFEVKGYTLDESYFTVDDLKLLVNDSIKLTNDDLMFECEITDIALNTKSPQNQQ